MMMNPVKVMPETWSAVGTMFLTFIFFMDLFRRYCPQELLKCLDRWRSQISGLLNPYIQISVHQYMGSCLRPHEAYAIIEAYLSDNAWKQAKNLKAEMTREGDDGLMLSMDKDEKTVDEFNGVLVQWISGKEHPPSQPAMPYVAKTEKRYYKLKFHKRYKEIIIQDYLKHVIKSGKEVQMRNRQRKLYTNGVGSYWSHTVFEHPATFNTLAMEPEKKQEIIDDLQTFSRNKDFYSRVGKPWKRGYLLYGPPGTGKTMMIVAMANLLNYDVYDLELTSVKDNTELRKLLTETTSKSIIVIEDIDCSLDLTGQRAKVTETEKPEEEETEKDRKRTRNAKEEGSNSKVTLSGLLNFIDGLWSACAGERLIVFTTNFVDKLDPALIRRGRMDKRINLSYCKYEGFKMLARNYLQVQEHPLFQSVRELIEDVEISPAAVAEILSPTSPNANTEQCLKELIGALEEANMKSGEEHQDREIN